MNNSRSPYYKGIDQQYFSLEEIPQLSLFLVKLINDCLKGKSYQV